MNSIKEFKGIKKVAKKNIEKYGELSEEEIEKEIHAYRKEKMKRSLVPQKILIKLKKTKAKKIFIQYPEGLTLKIVDIAKKLEKEGFEVLVCVEPCYGSCDLKDHKAKLMGCDTILHIGHSDFGLESEIPVIYWEYEIDVDPIPTLEKEFHKLKPYKKIGLVTSVQFVKAMNEVKEYLEKNGKEVFVHKTLKYPGQVLGCCVYSAEAIEDKVDAFVYVGAGKFHPLGVAIKVDKLVFSLDLEKNEIISLEKEKMKYLKKKAWHDSQLDDAKTVGILVSWKKGQNRVDEARKLKENLEKKGKEVTILVFDRITKEKLEGLKFDVLVNMVCPRMDDEIYSL
ncbi:MAG: diphthamide biosynthesis enzyme Dph2 [Candidatus Aenigmarchaeota archaeon]|nr:diphthamide biosynthesis enzyme Dph2 [Candidatus Aenigmarchaeota archaeon]